MSDKLILTERIRNKYVSKNKYEGYGQIVTVTNDGYDVIVTTEPYDPIMGVQILWNSPSKVWITPPTIPPKEANLLKKNMDEAVKCVEELRRRIHEMTPPVPHQPI